MRCGLSSGTNFVIGASSNSKNEFELKIRELEVVEFLPNLD
jgi:hypothetical protein